MGKNLEQMEIRLRLSLLTLSFDSKGVDTVLN